MYRGTMRLATILALTVAAVQAVPPASRAANTVPTTIKVPAKIDATGRTDVTAKLRRFVDSVPNGATVVFPHDARYRINGTLEWRDRTGITLDGNGASLVAGVHGGPTRAHVRLVDGGGWTIRNLTVKGADPTGRYNSKYQWQHGFDLRGVNGAILKNVTVSNVFGDDIYVGLSTTSSDWSQNISVINSRGTRSGRMSISITAGRNVTVQGGVWSQPAFTTFDIEPNRQVGGAERVLIEDTTVGPEGRPGGASLILGHGLISTGSALAIIGNAPVSNVTLRDNTLTGRPLHVVAEQPDNLRPQNIVVQDNTATPTYAGPPPAAMYFRNVDGLTVTGNRQLIQAGRNLAMVATRGSTRVKVSGAYPYRDLTPIGSRIPYVVAAVSVVLSLLVVYSAKRRRATGGQSGRRGGYLWPKRSPTKRP